jgi:hypothetical protein
MSDEAAPVAAPTAPAAEPAAPAQPEPAQAPKESFADAFRRHEAKLQAEGKIQPETPEAAPAPPEPAAPKPNGKKVVRPAGDPKLEQLNALAKELGMAVEAGKVMPSERAKFRQYQREREGKLGQAEQERLSKLEAREKEAEETIKWASSLKKTKENGDYQGLAKELGFENWDKLQEDVIARISDPNYKRLRELEERAAREEEEKTKAKAEQERTAAQQKQVELRQAVWKKFATEMPQSKDPLVSAMGDHPMFVSAALRIQEEQWDGTALPYERIAGMAAKGTQRTLREECKDLYDRLHKAFGGQTAAPPPVKKPVGKSAPVPPSRGVEASGAKVMSREERNLYERRRLEEAIDKDRKAAREA